MSAAGDGDRAPRRRGSLATPLLLGGIVLVAFALRVWRLGDVPFGLHPDEGHNAVDALRIAQGWRPVFLPGNNGREPLFMYLMAALVSIAGPSIWAVRLTGAITGTLVVPAIFVFARSLPLPRARTVALVAAALAATTFWPVAQSRVALRAGLLPVWVALVLWAWWRALDGRTAAPSDHRGRARRPLGWAVATGVFLAAGTYTHLSGRFLPLALVASAAWAAWRGRQRAPVLALAVALVTGGVLCSPMALYFARHPEMLSLRADQVSVLNPAVNEGDLVGYLARNAWHLLRAPVLEGDRSWYHNLSRLPVFDPLAGAAFLVGLLLLGRDVVGGRGPRPQWLTIILLSILVITVAPSWMSIGAPNYVRLTGAWPVLFVAAAYGIERTGAFVGRQVGSRAGIAVVVVALVVSGLNHTLRYFWDYAGRPEVYTAFNGAAVERGRLVADLVREGPTYVSPSIWKQSVIRFLNVGQPPRSYDLTSGVVFPPSGTARYVFEPGEEAAAARFGTGTPWAFDVRPVYDRQGAASLLVIRSTTRGATLPGSLTRTHRQAVADLDLPVTFGQAIDLYDALVTPVTTHGGDLVTVTMVLAARAPTAADHNLFIHVETVDGRSLGQFDGPPLAGSYGTDRWAPGEWIVQPVAIRLAEDAPAGDAEIRLGWYDWRTGARLPVPGDDDAAVTVGAIRVTE
jgi:4-amino-4-deoxy-L-arabinose transferase-like glycosyltransferase